MYIGIGTALLIIVLSSSCSNSAMSRSKDRARVGRARRPVAVYPPSRPGE